MVVQILPFRRMFKSEPGLFLILGMSSKLSSNVSSNSPLSNQASGDQKVQMRKLRTDVLRDPGLVPAQPGSAPQNPGVRMQTVPQGLHQKLQLKHPRRVRTSKIEKICLFHVH